MPARIESRNHLCGFYDNEGDLKAVIGPYIQQGLYQREKLLCIVGAHTQEIIYDYCIEKEMDLTSFLNTGQLVFQGVHGTFIKKGVFDPHVMAAFFQDEAEGACAKGFEGLRIVTEMDWVSTEIQDIEKLVSYETEMNAFFAGSEGKPTNLCLYDMRIFNEGTLMHIMENHPIIATGAECYENIYYIPPEEIPESDPYKAVLQNRLKALKRFKDMDEALKRFLEGERAHTVEALKEGDCIINDISERITTESAIRESEEKYRNIFQNAVEGIFQITPEGCYLSANPALAKMYGFRLPERMMEKVTDIERQQYVNHEDYLQFKKLLDGKGTLKGFEVQQQRKDGRKIWISINARVVRSKSGEILYYEGTAENITERRRVERELIESEERYRTAIECSNDGVVLLAGGEHFYINDRFIEIFGYSARNEFQEKSIFMVIHPDDREKALIHRRRILAGEETPSRYEAKGIRKDGTTLYIEISVALVNYRGEAVVLAYVRDITERRQAEEELKASLKEKEVLLKEIHHRVKNNLQIVSSLLNLQSGYLSEGYERQALMESQNRIRSMALIHDRLYRSENLASIDFAQYVTHLARDLFHTYGIDPDNVRMKVNIDHLFLNIDIAIPCGLIINELITNSLKHAFPGGRSGEIAISLLKRDDNMFTLKMCDNGIGFNEGVDFHSKDTLGLQLVNTLVEQLEGNMELKTEKGFEFTITFQG
jgi:PAS domain S-box-containing protein